MRSGITRRWLRGNLLITVLLVLLAVWHSVMYIGETLSPGFYAKYYDLIDKISLGTAVRSDVVEGYGVVRIIQVTSILMIPGVFLSVRKCLNGEWFGAVGGAVTVFALLITYTKSIWFGCFGTLLAALLIAALLYKPRVLRRRAAGERASAPRRRAARADAGLPRARRAGGAAAA